MVHHVPLEVFSVGFTRRLSRSPLWRFPRGFPSGANVHTQADPGLDKQTSCIWRQLVDRVILWIHRLPPPASHGRVIQPLGIRPAAESNIHHTCDELALSPGQKSPSPRLSGWFSWAEHASKYSFRWTWQCRI